MPVVDLVSLRDCPPGLFRFGETIGFKTEYRGMETVGPIEVPGDQVRWIVGNHSDAYVVESGESFWGGAPNRDARDALLVEPVDLASLPCKSGEGAGESFLDQLRRVNLARYEAWVEGSDAGIMFDALELGGEVGELLNVVKKMEREERGWRGSRASSDDFADECADVLICLDKLARRKGVNLAAATIAKFNATSEKVDVPHRLSAIDATQTREAELVAALSGLELTEDGYSLRVAYDGDAAYDGRAIVVGGETVVTFTDSDEGEAVREAILKIMGKPA